MSNKPISVALSILSAGAVAWAAASCSNSTNGGSDDGGSESGSSSSSSSSSGGTSSSSGASSSSSSGSSSGTSSGVDAGGTGEGGSACTGSAAGQALLDDMSASMGTAITFKPPTCAQKGTWFNYAGAGGGTISPTPFAFSALPAGLPAEAGAPEGGASDAASSDGGDGGVPVLKAACVNGATGTAAYSSTGMGFNLATTPNPDGGYANPVAIDAHSYTGIQFWAWGGAVDGGGSMQSVTVQAYDKNETPGFGVCDPAGTGGTACGSSQFLETFNAGWQFIKVSFAQFAANPGYGDMNEMMLDPSTLTKIQWQVQLANPDGGAPIPFDFCVYDVSFY